LGKANRSAFTSRGKNRRLRASGARRPTMATRPGSQCRERREVVPEAAVRISIAIATPSAATPTIHRAADTCIKLPTWGIRPAVYDWVIEALVHRIGPEHRVLFCKLSPRRKCHSICCEIEPAETEDEIVYNGNQRVRRARMRTRAYPTPLR
jgi:hypothetical protein